MLPCGWLDETRIEDAVYSFSANHINQHYGDEYDVDLTQKIATHYAICAQFADYKVYKLLADARKIIVAP